MLKNTFHLWRINVFVQSCVWVNVLTMSVLTAHNLCSLQLSWSDQQNQPCSLSKSIKHQGFFSLHKHKMSMNQAIPYKILTVKKCCSETQLCKDIKVVFAQGAETSLFVFYCNIFLIWFPYSIDLSLCDHKGKSMQSFSIIRGFFR